MNTKNFDITEQRILGIYPQKQTNLFMQRVPVVGGRLSWQQWRTIAEIAAELTPDTPLHITTRQSIELHNITADLLSEVQHRLCSVGLPTLGACGDTVRNITCCAGCDAGSRHFDVFPVSRLLAEYIVFIEGVFAMPRKFKISFSGCQKSCAKPWLSDIGFVAQKNGLFRVIGAGSLGARPALGIELYSDLPAADILPLTIAAIEFFEQAGDRKNRRTARLRHVRERLGDDDFKKQLDEHFARIKSERSWPAVEPAPGRADFKRLTKLHLPNGNISAKLALELAAFAEPRNTTLRINLEHALELYGNEPLELTEELTALSLQPAIIACPGSSSCPNAITDCYKTADNIRARLAGTENFTSAIHISGCPNNCAQSQCASLGLIGAKKTIDGQKVDCYRLFTDGGNGKNNKLAEQLDTISDKDIPDTIYGLIKS